MKKKEKIFIGCKFTFACIGKNCLFKKSNPFTLSQLVLIPESYEFLRDYDFMMCQMPHMLTQSYICNCEPEKASGSERNQWF